jgi:hypothetical protein
MGFVHVAAGPKVRSSYHADEQAKKVVPVWLETFGPSNFNACRGIYSSPFKGLDLSQTILSQIKFFSIKA